MIKEVVALSEKVAEFIRAEAQSFDLSKVEQKKGFSDLVSYVDQTAEKMIVEGLSNLLPEAGFIAEEGTGSPSDSLNWIIDPLDGTTNFIHGLPVYAISIALSDGEDLQLGLVHEINQNECFVAEKRKGAFLNGQKIKVSSANRLSASLLATGFPYYEFEGLPDYLRIIESFMQKTQGLRRMGSAAVDLVYTACGRFEGYFEYNLNAWDIAAGALIVKEAGGTVTNFSGGDSFLFEREIIAAGE